ncbi:hypothetical protein HWV62_18710 [Athelia sp. TMB]|nr:hypothetical protein HWV62_18710 [Athelia sp. TMB]
MIAPSALMHASLAAMSPELITLNTIIRLRSSGALKVAATSRPTTSILAIPPEILLAIRGHLLPLVITHLTTLSGAALVAYEATRRAQLCAECLEFNTHVFGPDLWAWPGTGACHCGDVGRAASTRRALFKSKASLTSPRGLPKPANEQEWLELYLSKRAKRVLAARDGPRASISKGIWDLVAGVLQEHECRIDGDTNGALLCLVPALSRDADTAEERWRAAAALGRVQRELGLSAATAVDGAWRRPKLSHDNERLAPRGKTETPAIKAQSRLLQPSVLLSMLALGVAAAVTCI